MITSGIFFVITGTIPYFPALSILIDNEPIKIIVNENFNALPDHITQGFLPSSVNQGANFYFNPKLVLPPGYVSSHIKPLISSINQRPDIIKDNIIEFITPFDNSLSNFVSTPSPTRVVVEEKLEVLPPPMQVIINDEIKPNTAESIVIPEAPVLPPLSFNAIPPFVLNEVKIEEPMLLEEYVEELPLIPVVSTETILEPGKVPEKTIKENVNPVVITKPIKYLGVFTTVPNVSHLPAMIKEIDLAVPETKEFLMLHKIKNHPFSLPPFSKFPFKILMTQKFQDWNDFLYRVSCTHNFGQEHIAPDMIYKRIPPKDVKIDIRSDFLIGPVK